MRRWWFLPLVVLAWLWPSVRGQAATGQQDPAPADRVVFGEDFVLPAGEMLPGNLLVVAGSATLEPNSQVRGDVIVMGGTVEAQGVITGQMILIGGHISVDGSVAGDVVLVGGQVALGPHAQIGGDVVLVTGSLQQDPRAHIAGQVLRTGPHSWRGAPQPIAPLAPSSWRDWAWHSYRQVLSSVGRGLQALAVAAVAALLALFVPQVPRRLGEAAQTYPWHSLAAGALVSIVTPVLALVVALTLVGIPVALLLLAALALAYWVGLMGLGWLLGHRIAQAAGWNWTPPIEAGVGTLALSLVLAGLRWLWCLGWILVLVVALLAVGVTALTWLGTRSPTATLQWLGEQTTASVPPSSASTADSTTD